MAKSENYPRYQQRVIQEKIDLDTRIERLDTFCAFSGFDALDAIEQGLLTAQLKAMQEYSRILGERIAHFPVTFQSQRNCAMTLPELIKSFEELSAKEGNDPITCSRMHFKEWADKLRLVEAELQLKDMRLKAYDEMAALIIKTFGYGRD